MSDELKTLLFVLFITAYFVGLAIMATSGIVQNREREYVCITIGYDGYDQDYEACRVEGSPVVLYPYETAFSRIE